MHIRNIYQYTQLDGTISSSETAQDLSKKLEEAEVLYKECIGEFNTPLVIAATMTSVYICVCVYVTAEYIHTAVCTPVCTVVMYTIQYVQ